MTGTSLAGKRALVTGANRGIGAALVDAFLAAGAAEVIAAARQAVPARERVIAARLDVTDVSGVQALAGRHAAQVDILVNNAGFNGNCGALEPAVADAARR